MSANTPEQRSVNGRNQVEGIGTAATGSEEESRRAFLAKCGRFAIVTPPAVTLLLHTSMASADGGYGSPVKHGRKKHRGKRKRPRHHRKKHYHKHYHRHDHDHDDKDKY